MFPLKTIPLLWQLHSIEPQISQHADQPPRLEMPLEKLLRFRLLLIPLLLEHRVLILRPVPLRLEIEILILRLVLFLETLFDYV